ncbi:MAG: serine/threonine protein kinase [Fimbriiglobus sp.]
MNAPASKVDLLELVRKSGIIRSETLSERLRDLPEIPDDPKELAAILIERSIITKFQAKYLLTGKYRGFKLGSYVILEQIGQGGMGAVFLAEHESLRRKVAIKVLTLPKNEATPKLSIERFMREARAAAALDHPNIVRIHDVAQHQNTHYLVMEYVDGWNLDEVLAKSGAIPASRVVDYIAQAAAGLQHAHEKGFIHRDIKPANLILTREGVVKILDMGLAKSNDNNDRLTQQMDADAVVGTADYISPEQAMNDPGIDIRTDIYSLGVSFFALVTGRPPFDGNTTQKLMQHQMLEAPRLDDVDTTFPVELADVIAKMMAKKPEQRYKNPAEVITALAPWLGADGANRVMAGISSTDLGSSVEMRSTMSELASSSTKRLRGKSKLITPPKSTKSKFFYPIIAAVFGAILAVAGIGAWLTFSVDEGRPNVTQTPAWSPPEGKEQVQATPTKTTPTKPTTNKPPVPTVPVSANSALKWQYKVPQGLKHQTKVKLGGPKEPKPFEFASWIHILTYKPANEAELFTETIEGTTGLGMRNLTGNTAQVLLNIEKAVPNGLIEGHSYELAIKYATKGGPKINLATHRGEKWSYVSSEEIPISEGRWTTLRRKIVRGAEPERRSFDLMENSPDRQVFFASLELVDTTSGKTDNMNYLLRWDQHAEGRTEISAGEPTTQHKLLGQVEIPTGVILNRFRTEAHSLFEVTQVDGQKALKIQSVNGEGGTQINTRCDDVLTKLPTNQKAQIRVTYRLGGTTPGSMAVELAVSPYSKLSRVVLPPTGANWETIDLTYQPNDTTPEVTLLVSPERSREPLWIKSIEVMKASDSKAVIQTDSLYTLQLQNIQPFSETGQKVTRTDWKTLESKGTVAWPLDWSGRAWNFQDKASLGVELVDGQPALFAEHLEGVGSLMLFGPVLDFKASRIELEIEYMTETQGKPKLRFRPTQPTDGVVFDLPESLILTKGKWHTQKMVLDLNKYTAGQIEFHYFNPGTNGKFRLRKMIVRNVPSAAKVTTEVSNPPTPPSDLPAVGRFDLAQGMGFETIVENLNSAVNLREAAAYPMALRCTDPESKVEFRRGKVEGKDALSVTNLSGPISAEVVLLGLEDYRQAPRYRVTIEYLTTDTAGELVIVKPTDLSKPLGTFKLPSTQGQWQTLNIEFDRPPAGGKVEAQIRNTGTGAKKTLSITAISISPIP